MKTAWLCIILNRRLYKKGIEACKNEMQRLMGNSFIDLQIVDDGFEEECYAFIKCDISGNYMEKLRYSSYVDKVLASYDSPTYLQDEEVKKFVTVEEKELECFQYGDIVKIEGESAYVGLNGVIVLVADLKSQVLFRFHTMSQKMWFENNDLKKNGSIFTYINLPIDCTIIKHPVSEGKYIVNPSESDRGTHRPDNR
jgi:hypothetical protein